MRRARVVWETEAGAETWLCDGTRISYSRASERQCGFPMGRRGCAAGSCNGPRDACMSVGDRQTPPRSDRRLGVRSLDDGRQPTPHGLHTGSEQGVMAREKEVWTRREAADAPGFVSPSRRRIPRTGVEIEETDKSRAEADNKRPNWCLRAGGWKLEVRGILPGFPHPRYPGIFGIPRLAGPD